MRRLTIYSRPGCHLCDEMKQVIARVVDEMPAGSIVIDETDISRDIALEQRYGEEIPVLLIDGRKAAKYRINEDELRRKLKE